MCVCVCCAVLCVLPLGLLQGVAEGGPLRLTRSASFFAGLCGMPSATWLSHVNQSCAGSWEKSHLYLSRNPRGSCDKRLVSNVAKCMVFWKFHLQTGIINVSVNTPVSADFNPKRALSVSKRIISFWFSWTSFCGSGLIHFVVVFLMFAHLHP